MRTMKLGKTGLSVPVIASGCMRLNGLDEKQAASYLHKCLELGICFFDHSDIYGGGYCEEIFAKTLPMTSSVREKIMIQSKCGILPGVGYDCSKSYILSSVDGILKRLRTDYLDVFLLHRPDALMEPEEVAEAFDRLEQSGKVRVFGVSNQNSSQIRLLKKCVRQHIAVDQLQFSIPFSQMISRGMEVNMDTDGAEDRDGGILDYCRLEDITIQAWSPFQVGDGTGTYLGNENYSDLNSVMDELSDKYRITPAAVGAAWILRHPAKIQVIAGTMNEERLAETAKAADVKLTREEWYRLYLAAGHRLP